MSAGKIKFHVRGNVMGLGRRTHIIRAANDHLAKGKFLLCYPDREIADLVALTPIPEEDAA